MNKLTKEKKKNALICIGTGLVALDVIMNGNPKTPSKIFAGGSCGNVMAILAFLSWDSHPIARLKKNVAAKELISDLEKSNVKTDMITVTDDGSTPIIIQRIKKDKMGNPIHKFEFKNPDHGGWLPSYKPVLSASVDTIVKKNPKTKVFYFDRVNRASIEFAKFYKEQGALIYFEPSSVGEMRLFKECLEVSDVIKFSSDRISNYSTLFPAQQVPLEIETLGKEGSRFRFSHKKDKSKWTSVSSYNVSYFLDAAGAGDWTSAGIISKIGQSGLEGFKKSNSSIIEEAIYYGQALGALNCFFDGARGMMYHLTKLHVNQLVKKLQKEKTPIAIIPNKENTIVKKQVSISSLY